MNFSIVSAIGNKKIVDSLLNAPQIMTAAKKAALTTAAMIFQTKSKEEAPTASTNLRKNIKIEVDNDGNQAKVFVDDKIEYGIYQEEGTGIHGPKHSYIFPKRAKMLRWEGKSGVMFARKVQGVKPRWFMKKGMQELVKQGNKVDEKLYSEIKKGLGL